jgi:hypothetical protein
MIFTTVLQWSIFDAIENAPCKTVVNVCFEME